MYSLDVLLSNFDPVYCSMSSSNCCFLSCIQVSQEVGYVVLYCHLINNIPQFVVIHTVKTSLVAQTVKCLPAMQEIRVQSLGQEYTLEKEMATHSSTLAWKITWTEERDRLQSMGSQRVGHDWATSLYLLYLHSQRLQYNQWSRIRCFFLELSCFSYEPTDVGNLISDSSAFSKSNLYIWNFLDHVLLKTSLKDFEHNLAGMWNECNCMVIWTFFGIAFLWDWNEN